MQDVRVDKDGNLRCWNCGGKNFLGKRTGRAHIIGYLTVGVGALATKKKLKCQQCGKYNQVGDAQPHDPAPATPAPRRAPAKVAVTDPNYYGSMSLADRSQLEQLRSKQAKAPEPDDEPDIDSSLLAPSAADRLRDLRALHEEGLLSDSEYEARRSSLIKDL